MLEMALIRSWLGRRPFVPSDGTRSRTGQLAELAWPNIPTRRTKVDAEMAEAVARVVDAKRRPDDALL